MSNENRHIDADKWQRFFSFRMSENEKANFEKEVEQDDFAREAMEGFQSLDNKEKSLLMLNKIQKRIDQRTSQSSETKKVIPIFKIATIAASVVLLLGSAFFINSIIGKNGNLAEAGMTTAEEQIMVSAEEKQVANIDDLVMSNLDTEYDETLTIEQVPVEASNYGSISTQGAPPPSIADFIRNIKNDVNEDTYISPVPESPLEPDDIDEIPIANYQYDMIAEVEYEAREEIMEEIAGSDDSFEDVKKTSSESNVSAPSAYSYQEEITESISIFDEGINYFQQGQYAKAANNFETDIRNGNDTPETNYYAGLSYQKLSNANKAINYYDKVISTSTPLKYNAMWNKAELLLQKDKKKQAKTILEELAEGNSSYKEKAKEKLNNL